jgi:hypothetical protein
LFIRHPPRERSPLAEPALAEPGLLPPGKGTPRYLCRVFIRVSGRL